MDVHGIVTEVVKKYDVPVGIHCHNDAGMAVANSIIAVEAGARQVQGTINGFGERCGNANLCTIIANLQLKLGYKCIPEENMTSLTRLSRVVDEIANVVHDERAPYVGGYAFAHKGGMHVDAVNKNAASFEHVEPEKVGTREISVCRKSPEEARCLTGQEIEPSITKDSEEAKLITNKLKQMEHEGYQYEGAECSFEILVRKILGTYKPFFKLEDFKVLVTEPTVNGVSSSAMIKVKVGDQYEITAAEGDGPVNALDKAVRKALERFFPQIKEMKLTDYKVRVLDSTLATAAKVRVLIESSDGKETWSTIGVSTDIIDASWKALVDSIEYKLMKDGISVKMTEEGNN